MRGLAGLVSSKYSRMAVLSNKTCPSISSTGTLPAGLIARNS